MAVNQELLFRIQKYDTIRLLLTTIEVEINAEAKFLERKCKEVKPSRGFLDSLKVELTDQKEAILKAKDHINKARNLLDQLQTEEHKQVIPQASPESWYEWAFGK